MTKAELWRFLAKHGLVDKQTEFRALKGGYLNTVWRVDAPDIIAQGDALFNRCASPPEATAPPHVDVPPPQKLSLIHTDIGVNLVGAGTNLRLIDWQCPAIGDLCEDIYSFLSPAFQILGERAPLTDAQVRDFWEALARPDLEERYTLLRPAYAWRFAGYCAWRAEVLEDAAICARYRRALAEELSYMGQPA
jgi:thiamine kinase